MIFAGTTHSPPDGRFTANAFPTDVTVYLIELQSAAFGLELSEPVLASARRVIAEIQRTIDDYVAP